MFILDPFDRTVNKGNTVLHGREVALFDKMLETLTLLADTGKCLREQKSGAKTKHTHKKTMISQDKTIEEKSREINGKIVKFKKETIKV